MALLRIPQQGRTFMEPDAVACRLAENGLLFERWELERPLDSAAPSEAILRAYAGPIERLRSRGGYVTADVVDLSPSTPGLDALLARFNREHWHDEDEVRFVIEGRGIFHVRPAAGPVLAIEVSPGDLLCVPRGTWHWFDLCPERRIRAIRLFQDPAGWTPRYTDSGAERGYQPVCLGRDGPPGASGLPGAA